PTHCVRPAPMRGMNEELGIRFKERRSHGHDRAIREKGKIAELELLNEAEDVIPATAVEPDDVVTKLIEDLVHLEGRKNRFDQNRRLDRPVREAQNALGVSEDFAPKAGFQVVLELRKIKIRTGTARDELARIVKEIKAEIQKRSRNRLPIDFKMRIRKVPASRPDHENCDVLFELVSFYLFSD